MKNSLVEWHLPMRKLLLSLIIFCITLVAVQAQTVYKTRTGAKYHVATCGYLRSTFSTTIKDALAEGLTACSVCKPGGGTGSSHQTITPANNLVRGVAETTDKIISEAEQCKGTTKAGARCRRMTRATNGRCYQH